MFAILPLAWVMTNLKPEAAYREDLFNWHMTIGVIVLLITAFRVIWRVVDGPPPIPAAGVGSGNNGWLTRPTGSSS